MQEQVDKPIDKRKRGKQNKEFNDLSLFHPLLGFHSCHYPAWKRASQNLQLGRVVSG
jgi:hypothetical protein